ncbi:hypothetical protein MLD38_017184 [Melastoma candidum]|nr:hypothetical protein MLD38_017184 [Melastoma candidum]
MANKYGPIMYLKLGSKGLVVASKPEAARAFLKALDLNFSNRARDAGAVHMAYDVQDMVFADYGPRWRLMRKQSNLHMLGGKALEDWSHVRREEVGHMLRAMLRCGEQGEPVVVSDMLAYVMGNMISRVILSKRIFKTKSKDSDEFRSMVVELMITAGYFNVGDYLPCIAWMDIQGIERGMKKLHKRFDTLLTKLMEEHRTTSHERHNPDFLDVLMADSTNGGEDALTMANIKGLLLNLFTAGSDAPSSMIEWSLAEMLNKPSILKRAQEEMDRVIGRERRLEESDLKNLPYLRAICIESFRKHPPTPLNLPRISKEPCVVDGYYIPKDTKLSVNIWAIGRDPEVWEDPLEFIPERFLTEKYKMMDPRGNDFELLPFGSGRRMCAGTRMGILVSEYIPGSLVHMFDWKLPDGTHELNMDETFGLALQKTVPLTAFVAPRLSI